MALSGVHPLAAGTLRASVAKQKTKPMCSYTGNCVPYVYISNSLPACLLIPPLCAVKQKANMRFFGVLFFFFCTGLSVSVAWRQFF